MRKAADLYPGQAKTDPRAAFTIDNTARTMPHTLRVVDRNDEVLSALKKLSGLDDDIARDSSRTINRRRSILVQVYPPLERVFADESLQQSFVLELLIHYGSPTELNKPGSKRSLPWSHKHAKKDTETLFDDIFQALNAQTVTLPRSDDTEVAIGMLTVNIKSLRAQRKSIAGQTEEVRDDFLLAWGLMTMRGVGIKSRARTSSWPSATVPTSPMPHTWLPTTASPQ